MTGGVNDGRVITWQTLQVVALTFHLPPSVFFFLTTVPTALGLKKEL